LVKVVAHTYFPKKLAEKRMNEARPSMKTRTFLLFCAVGLVPIAMGYGAKPSTSLDALFGITVDTTNLTHIMRAVMGLYFGMVLLWVWGAFKIQMTVPALVSCAVFMLGLAAGRILSFILDGMPHWLLVVYAILEIVLGLGAIAIYKGDALREND
jgi:hypothetical protein